MATDWTPLPTDYKDASWEGRKKYNLISNADGTVSFEDVTTYIDKEDSFFGAYDANSMNAAINELMEGGLSGGLYVKVDYTIGEEEYIENSEGSWAMQYYVDIACSSATTTMIADVSADSTTTDQYDIGLLTYTDITTDGNVRCYFSSKPSGSYTIEYILLTTVTASSDTQDQQVAAANLSYYADNTQDLEEQRIQALALAATQKQAEEARLSNIESALDEVETKVDTLASEYIQSTEVSEETATVFASVLSTKEVDLSKVEVEDDA